ncbi:hypothetical protein [Rickettsia asembonensis]|uniref:hypothetical protein n=1 Tax=Rickettsia asembonensis TaxID=1068590 RepID=UPI0018F2348E|nr:hypothetical protein [Rickettsia asembonensis]
MTDVRHCERACLAWISLPTVIPWLVRSCCMACLCHSRVGGNPVKPTMSPRGLTTGSTEKN